MNRNDDERYMRRALELARCGAGEAHPNPMVGAVITAPDGRIIGEGFHRKYGGPHAEVNAFASIRVEDRPLIASSTIYVTLEPCSHYGKTPPCASLLINQGIKRCVAATVDPNPRVAGRGLKMLADAGIEVEEGLLREECRALNVRFFTAHTLKRPWIILKWAQDEYGRLAAEDGSHLKISTPITLALMHRERSECDAIMVGSGTLVADNPSLTTRNWPGKSPRPVIFESPRISAPEIREKLHVMKRNPIILDPAKPLEDNMKLLYEEHGVTSLMVEGGRKLLDSFMARGLYDRIRVESIQPKQTIKFS